MSVKNIQYGPLYVGGPTDANRIVTSGELSIGSGLTTLNGLTAVSQSLATGTAGNDFAVTSAVSTHTFNLPDASQFARGVVSTTAQTISGSKTFVAPMVTNDVQVSGNELIYGRAFNTSLDPAQRYVVSGELSVGVLTNVTLSGTTITYGPIYNITVTGKNRFVVSGELLSGVFINQQANFVTGSPIVFGPSSFVSISGNLLTNDVQVSGVELHYAPIYQGLVSAGSRFVTSGELAAGGGITSLNGLTPASQTFAVGSAGNDFAITSAGSVHTFDLPSATQFARGVVTTADQTVSGGKIFVDRMVTRDVQVSGNEFVYGTASFGGGNTVGAQFNVKIATGTIVLSTGVLTQISTGAIPPGVILGVTVHNVIAISGTNSGLVGYAIGVSGTLTAWGSTIQSASGLTTNVTYFEISAVPIFPIATDLYVTASGGARFQGGILEYAVHYIDFGGPVR